MAGRGKPKSGTLTREQLQSLGCTGNDMPQVQTALPPTYPPLMTKPTSLETTPAQTFQILWKETYLNHMRDSPYYLQLSDKKTVKEHLTCYSGKNINNSSKSLQRADFNWSVMPAELNIMNRKRQSSAKKIVAPVEKAKLIKKADIENRLKELEDKEKGESNDEDENKASTDSEEEKGDDVVDDEMDDENDYGNSYFDNGEAYNEEDDNLDDGPIY